MFPYYTSQIHYFKPEDILNTLLCIILNYDNNPKIKCISVRFIGAYKDDK